MDLIIIISSRAEEKNTAQKSVIAAHLRNLGQSMAHLSPIVQQRFGNHLWTLRARRALQNFAKFVQCARLLSVFLWDSFFKRLALTCPTTSLPPPLARTRR
jgi:hypothetical protein